MHKTADRSLGLLLLAYALASLVHFIHNAEFLSDYPNFPATWTRIGVYLVWLGLTGVGLAGWLCLSRGFRRLGLLLLTTYALGGIDSLWHYVVAPLAQHTVAMHVTILLEVAAAGLVLGAVIAETVRGSVFDRRIQ